MSYRQLGQQLGNYQQAIPDWLQQFFGEYSADPYQGAVLDEMQRRSSDTFGQNLGQMASYFGGAGRGGSGMMGRSMSDATAENQQRLRGDISGLLSGDYQGFMGRQMDAAGLMSGLQQTGMGGMAAGYGADQARQAQIRSAQIGADASRYQTDAYRNIGMGNLGMNRDFGTWDRQYQSDMMPYQQLNLLGSGVGGLMSPYATNQTSGSQTMQPGGSKLGNMAQGAAGGGMMGYGMGGGKGGGSGPGANFNTLPFAPGGRYDR